MKLQLKILLIIIPFLVLGLAILGLWSISAAKESTYRSTYRYMSNVLDSYINDKISLNYQLLKEAKLDAVESYVKNYQQDAFKKSEKISEAKGGHIFVVNESGEFVFSSLKHNPPQIELLWKDISLEIVDQHSETMSKGYVKKGQYHDLYVAHYFIPWGWVVFYSVPDDEVTASVNKILMLTLAIAALCALGEILFIFGFCNIYLVRPIDTLKDAAATITAHQRIKTIAVNSKDELGMLARSMEVMSESIHLYKKDLQQHHDSMEQLVRDRTFELSQANIQLQKEMIEREQREEEKQKLENRLQQAQKMEAIGTLAGGIAHDFNNILSAILGYAELAKDDCQPGSTISKDLDGVLEAGNRAKSLVRQILAFSHQENTERVPLQPASIVKETIKMLRPSLPTTIKINQNIDSQAGLVFADPTQIQQILMNLCTNAFHAMEETGGKLDISLKEVTLSIEDLVHEPTVAAGTFIQLSIGDSGLGIAPTIKGKIFDPYFTTKEAGKGTGMGLSMVHGIVKSYGGFISLYSELGEGAVFHVFFPVVEKEALPENEINDQIPIGREHILLVDDEEILATMGKTMLERLGYQVTERNSSLEALETFQNQPDQFDLVITDQTMPGMTGSDLSRKMLQIRPDIPIILCTGYSTIVSEKKAKSIGIKEFALKPLTKKDIAKLIRKVMDVS